MKTHIQIVAALNLAAGALYLIAATVVFLVMGLAGSIVISQGETQAAGIVAVVAIAIASFLAVLGLPSVIGGCALFANKSWARPLLLVLAVLHLPNIPFGTALGIYTLWALLREEQPPRLPLQNLQPIT
jgi:hypothetical protein